uniref:Uncharacterized protein n=1 Tax=Kuenenia stuttgartiensis TaxID=174633 RepID=Q1PWA4_KUEST|nr:unknown protein [Candidatus Kuenenia stuttgartiensis]
MLWTRKTKKNEREPSDRTREGAAFENKYRICCADCLNLLCVFVYPDYLQSSFCCRA